MLLEKNKEIDGMNKEFQRQIQVLVEDHKKEVDVSIFVEQYYYLGFEKDNLNHRPWCKRRFRVRGYLKRTELFWQQIYLYLFQHLMEKFAECVQDSEQLKSALLEMQVQKT